MLTHHSRWGIDAGRGASFAVVLTLLSVSGCFSDSDTSDSPHSPETAVDTPLLWRTTAGGGGGGSAPPNAIYYIDFQSGSPGWTLSPGVGNNNVGWAADSNPSPPGGYNSSNSLNYNDGVNYHAVTGGGAPLPNSGTALSPMHDITGAQAPTLSFWCNFQTEGNAQQNPNNNWDTRFLRIMSGGNTVYTRQYTDPAIPPPLNPTWTVEVCSTTGTWHQHNVVLNPMWTTFQCEFSFDTLDEIFNTYQGWFIDNYTIQ